VRNAPAGRYIKGRAGLQKTAIDAGVNVTDAGHI
jgi:hypothetical protein